MEGGLQAWWERLLKEGVLCWQDGPVLVVEQDLEGHGALSKTFCFIICKINIKVNNPGYDNELNEEYAKHI